MYCRLKASPDANACFFMPETPQVILLLAKTILFRCLLLLFPLSSFSSVAAPGVALHCVPATAMR